MKVLFIGFGSIARKHYNALRDLFPDAVCYALRSGKNYEIIDGLVNLYDWIEVPNDMTFAIVSTPTFRHTKDILMLLEYRIPIMLEKPISNSLEGLDVISEKIKTLSIHTYVACNLRFLPVIKYLREKIKEKTSQINEVNVYAGSYLPAWRTGVDFRKNYSAISEMGGGVHLDLFHELDYVCWIFGLPTRSYNIQRSVSSLDINSVDFASYSLLYPKFTANIILNYYRVKPKRSIEVVFDDEIWSIDLLKNEIKDSDDQIVFQNEDYRISDTYTDQLGYLINNLSNSAKLTLNTFEESLEILKICLKNDEIK